MSAVSGAELLALLLFFSRISTDCNEADTKSADNNRSNSHNNNSNNSHGEVAGDGRQNELLQKDNGCGFKRSRTGKGQRSSYRGRCMI